MKYLIPLLLMLTISCHKKIVTKNSNYEGNWFGTERSSSFELDIDSGSHLTYSRHGGGTDNISGTARLGSNNIHVGIYDFNIYAEPAKIDSIYMGITNTWAHWTMRLRSPKIYGGYIVTYYRK